MLFHTMLKSTRRDLQMVKEEYKELDIEVVKFENIDVITDSDNNNKDEGKVIP